MMTESLVPVLLFDDGLLDAMQRQALARSGFQVLETTDIGAGVRLLRESAQPMVALFGVSVASNTLTGLDQVSVLGELLRDEALGCRHSFILMTPTPYEIRLALRQVLERTHVTLLPTPLDRERLLSAMWLASTRIGSHGVVPLFTEVQ